MKQSSQSLQSNTLFPISPSIHDDSAFSLSFYGEAGELLFEAYAYEVGFFRFNWHPSLEILMVLKGSLNAYTENGIRQLSENDLMVINPNVGHATMLQTPKTVALVIHVSLPYLERLCKNQAVPVFECCSPDQPEHVDTFRQIRSSISRLFCAMQDTSPAGQLMSQSQLLLILSLLLSHFSCGTPSQRELSVASRQQEIIHTMIRYINRHFREKITLEDLARISSRNLSYVSSYFRQKTGIGFHDYLIRKRLTYAAYLLHNSDDSVLDIALDAGFPDAKALNQAFKKYFQISPRQYRSQLLTCGDASLKQLFPVKLPFDHPLLEEKFSEYIIN